jgi:membrane-associated protease RseP (regulator of RpoE activity)
LLQGVLFSVALLAILLAHEFGHYIACRRYRVNATLPFFIPAPPLFLAGTFGAFIKIKSPIPTRRALFDIGIAGPLAGFVVAVPIAFIGVLTLQPAPAITGDSTVVIFNDPLLFRIFARVLGIDLSNAAQNPFYFAAWIGMLVTSLNLMPVGQLDGGHATYSLFGANLHKWIGRAAFGVVSALAVMGWFWHGSPSGFLYAVLLGVMLRLKHPRVDSEGEPLERSRMILAAITLAVFALSFLPFPIEIL